PAWDSGEIRFRRTQGARPPRTGRTSGMIDPVAIIGTHLPRAASPLFPDLLWRIPTREKRAYLTFDDGPTATMTALLAGILESFGARASFFLVGSHAEHHPDLARSLLRSEEHTSALQSRENLVCRL